MVGRLVVVGWAENLSVGWGSVVGRSVSFNMVGGWPVGRLKTCRWVGGRLSVVCGRPAGGQLPVVGGGPVGGLVVVCQWFSNTPELYLNFYFKITSKWQKYNGFLLNRRKTSTNIVLFWK